MALSIQERIKDLRVERKLTLEQLAEQTGLSKSALGSYESDDYKDISHYALNKLADFYGVTTDYLLARTETKKENSDCQQNCLLLRNDEYVVCIDSSTGKVVSWSKHDKDGVIAVSNNFYEYFMDRVENAIANF